MDIMSYWIGDKPQIGIMITKRPHDWLYINFMWWWGGVMINLWKTK